MLSVGNLALSLVKNSVLPIRGKLQSFSISLTLGISLFCVASYTLGLAQLDVRPFFWSFFFLGMGFAAYRLIRFPWKRSAAEIRDLSINRLSVAQVTFGCVFVIAIISLIVISTSNPGSDWDAVQLYLPMGRIVFENGFLPTHSQEIGRDIVNFFMMSYVDGYAMTVSGNFLFPISILTISWMTLIGLAATTYEIALKILGRNVESMVAVAFTLTLPIIAFYFAWTPRYVDVPSVFLAFSLILVILNCASNDPQRRAVLVLRNSCVGLIAFTAMGFKLQNLLALAPMLVLFIESVRSTKKKALTLIGMVITFVFAIAWGLNYGTILSDLAFTGTTSPVLVVVVESSVLLSLFLTLAARKDAVATLTRTVSFLPGAFLGYVLWFIRPTILESTPFYPASLPSTPAYLSARQTYSSIVRSLFPSSALQYGIAVPYLDPNVGPLLFPLIVLGGYSLLQRKHLFALKWVLLLNAAATILTGYVDSRYAIWAMPLSGILVGEAVIFLKKSFESSNHSFALTTLILMSLGLGVKSTVPTFLTGILPLFVLLSLIGSLYVALLVWSFAKRQAISRLTLGRLRITMGITVLLAIMSISLFALTYGNLIIDNTRRQGLETRYEEVYAFLQGNIPKGTTVLAVGFPGIYYRTGLNSIPLDDPEGLARLYPFSSENNLTTAAEQLKDSGVSSIIVPTNQNNFWYGYYQSLKTGLPIVTTLTSQPVSRQAFAGSDYVVYQFT